MNVRQQFEHTMFDHRYRTPFISDILRLLSDIIFAMLPYFGKWKQMIYHLNLSYWCFRILPSVPFSVVRCVKKTVSRRIFVPKLIFWQFWVLLGPNYQKMMGVQIFRPLLHFLGAPNLESCYFSGNFQKSGNCEKKGIIYIVNPTVPSF